MSTPTSQINICSGVRLNNAYNHTIWFASQSDQLSYFEGKVVKTFPSYTYLRKSWSIKVDATMEQARTWSYLYFRNGTGKYYFYFITNIEYINDSTVELSLDLDVMQTYAFDYTLLPSFVEREHVSNDAIGQHVIDEGLEKGEYKVIDEKEINLGDMCLLILTSIMTDFTSKDDVASYSLGKDYDGVFSGLGIEAVASSDFEAWGLKLKDLDTWGYSDSIVAMWMYPKKLVTLHESYTWDDDNVTKMVDSVDSFYESTSRNTKLSGAYVPKNNKLFTYPYNFLYVTNNGSNAGVFPYEKFGDTTDIRFRVVGSVSPCGSVNTYPLNFNGVQHNYEEGIAVSNFPSCAWNQDVYKLWLAQNQNQLNVAGGMAALKIAGGVGMAVASGGMTMVAGGGMVASGLSDISQLLAQTSDKEVQPPQAKGNFSSSVAVANNFNCFVMKRKSIDHHHAQLIDDYFTMYGYRITRVKTPNVHVRKNWTYTKTVGCNITGNFCNEDLTKIQSIFDKGITFWCNGDSIGNYSLDNSTL